MEALKKAFYDVMYKYEKYFSEYGVMENLYAWDKNKGALTDLLRRHPDWREEEKAVVFHLSEGREIDRDTVDECKFALNELAENIIKDAEMKKRFDTAMTAATCEYAQFPSDDNISVIREKADIKCASGQKTSRIIGRLCIAFGVDRHSEYNAVFARLADAFNPMLANKTAVLSVHPCDFLEMSNKDNSWSSCHGLAAGSYQAGCLSYLSDGASMVFYTVDDDVKSDFHKYPKRTRQIFCYEDNVLLQSRLYPSDNDALFVKYRHTVQKAIAVCLNRPNKWLLKAKNTEGFFRSAEGSRQYPDYDYYGKVSLLKGSEFYGEIEIGHPSLCVCCGMPYSTGRLKCSCEDKAVCADCGKTVSADHAIFSEGVYFCKSCLHICASCGKTIHSDMYPAICKNGDLAEVCFDCYSAMTTACADCGIHTVCDMVFGCRFCMKTNIKAIAA